MLKNKRGLLRIIEATIAILIIFGALLVINGMRKTHLEKDISESLVPLLEEIARNETLREKIVQKYDTSQDITSEQEIENEEILQEVREFLREKITSRAFNFDVKICDTWEVCGLPEYPANAVGDVFAEGRIVSSTLEIYEPKRLKLFLWRIA